MWNDTPNNIRIVESAALFKKQVRNYFLGQGDIEDPLKHDLQEEKCDLRYIFVNTLDIISLLMFYSIFNKIDEMLLISTSYSWMSLVAQRKCYPFCLVGTNYYNEK